MRRSRLDWRAARGLSVAVAGLFAGHFLLYRLVAPNALQRAYLLASTGHAYLPTALTLGVGLAAVAAVGTLVAGFRRAHGGGTRAQGLLVAVVAPALAQSAAFIVLEVTERRLAGAPLTGLLGPLLPIGVLLQLVVGALGGLALFGLERAAERAGELVAARRRRPRYAVTAGHPAIAAQRSPRPLPAEAFGIRGPPVGA